MKIRLNIGGHSVYGEKEDLLALRHLDESQVRVYFGAAQDNGMVSFELRGKRYTLLRQPDYTFHVVPGQQEGSYFA